MSETEDRKKLVDMMKAASRGEATPGVTLPQSPMSTAEQIPAGLLDFDLPVEAPILPTQGLVYSDPALKGVTNLEIKAITTHEENILVNPVFIKKGTVIGHLIQSCLLDKRIDANKLTAGDKNTLLVAIRAVGYGREYTPEISCPSCETKQEFVIDLASLPLKMLDLEKLEQVTPFENEFAVRLPASGKRVTFKFLTGGEEEMMATESEMRKKKGLVEQPVTQRLQSIIQSIEGVTNKQLISKFVSAMPGRDSIFLRKYYDDNEPGIDMRQEFACKFCDHKEVLAVPLGPTFLWPNAK